MSENERPFPRSAGERWCGLVAMLALHLSVDFRDDWRAGRFAGSYASLAWPAFSGGSSDADLVEHSSLLQDWLEPEDEYPGEWTPFHDTSLEAPTGDWEVMW